MRLYVVRSMLGDDRGGRRLVPPQSISGHAIRDRLHLVRSEALELRTPSSSRTPMALTVRQKRARNAVYPSGPAFDLGKTDGLWSSGANGFCLICAHGF